MSIDVPKNQQQNQQQQQSQKEVKTDRTQEETEDTQVLSNVVDDTGQDNNISPYPYEMLNRNVLIRKRKSRRKRSNNGVSQTGEHYVIRLFID